MHDSNLSKLSGTVQSCVAFKTLQPITITTRVNTATDWIWPLRFKQVCIQLPTSAVYKQLLAFAAERRAAAPLLLGAQRRPVSIHISCLHGTQQQTRRTRLPSNDGTDGRTERRTHDRFIDPAPGSVNNLPIFTNCNTSWCQWILKHKFALQLIKKYCACITKIFPANIHNTQYNTMQGCEWIGLSKAHS